MVSPSDSSLSRREHGILTEPCVHVDPGKGPALCHGVPFAGGEGKVAGGGLGPPNGLHGYGGVVGGGAGGAAARVTGASRVRGGAHGEVQVVDPCGDVHRVGEAREVSSDGHDQAVQRATGGFLPELAGCKPEDMPVHGDTAHVLVASSKAGGWCAPDHVAVDPRDGAVTGHHWPSTRAEDTATAREHGEVVCILQVGAPGKVPKMQRRGQVGGGRIGDPPVRVHGVSEAGIRD